MDLKRLSAPAVREHLQLDSPSKPELSIRTLPYESVYTELQAICAALSPKDKVWICDKASCALTQVIPKVREPDEESWIVSRLLMGGQITENSQIT